VANVGTEGITTAGAAVVKLNTELYVLEPAEFFERTLQ